MRFVPRADVAVTGGPAIRGRVRGVQLALVLSVQMCVMRMQKYFFTKQVLPVCCRYAYKQERKKKELTSTAAYSILLGQAARRGTVG